MSYKYNKSAEAFNQIDPVELDKLALTNVVAKERQRSEMVNALRKIGKLFSFVTDDKIEYICDRLQEQGFGFVECKQGFNSIPDKFDKFPAYKDIVSVVSSYKKTETINTSDDPVARQHRLKRDGLKNMWLTKYTQEQLTNYVEWYYASLVGIDKEQRKIFTSDLWEMSPLFDWHDNFYRLDKEELAKVWRIKETQRIANNRNNGNLQCRVINTNEDYKQYV